MRRWSVTMSRYRLRWKPLPNRFDAGTVLRRVRSVKLRARCHPSDVPDPEITFGSDGALISTRTWPQGATRTPFTGADRNRINRAQSTAMLSKRASPEDSSTLELAMVRSGATHTLTMATSPGVIRRTDTRKDTGSSSKGSTGKGTGTGLTGATHPLTAATNTATKTAIRIDITRRVSIRPRPRGLV
jgi:hypothetical protein